MSLDLPLVRGSVDPLAELREGFDPVRLLREGADALPVPSDGVRAVCAFAATPGGGLLVEGAGTPSEPLRLSRLEACDALALIDEGATALLLGLSSGGELGIGLALRAPLEREGMRWAHLRWSGHLLMGDDPAFAMPLSALAAWHAASRFCSRCGAPVRPVEAGWASECSGCARLDYPRQDPAIIVRIEDADGRILLAHNAAWVEPMHSLIAGFVEAGESPEAAVVREVREEVGLEIEAPVYRATQPWPFPRSQMMGFVTRLASGCAPEPRPDGVEITRARFYSRAEFAAAIAEGSLTAPGPTSIAHALVAEWYGGPIPPSPLALDPLRRP